MTRPRKQTVDWFPHSVNHGRTMFTLEKRYGIAGYGFWFKLLEVLGNTEGHFIDADDPATLEFLAAHTYTDKTTCLEILDLLATLDAIDPKLWKQKIIWTDNFVAGLAALYRNRHLPIPDRPDNYRQKSGATDVLGARNPIRKEGKEGKEGKEKDIAPPGVPPVAALMFFSCQFFEVDFDYRMKLAKEYPALNDDLLKAEFSKMEDWLIDNKSKKKFKSNGHLGNPRLFIKNWLNRVTVDGQHLFGPRPKGAGAIERARMAEAAKGETHG